MSGASERVLKFVTATGLGTTLNVEPSPKAIVSWNTAEPLDTIELVVDTANGHRSRMLPYAVFEPGARTSLNGFDHTATIDTDVVNAAGEIVAISVRSHRPLARVAASTPPTAPPRTDAPNPAARRELDVPQFTQFDPEIPEERGWCAPASMAMLMHASGVRVTVLDAVHGMFDRSYNGTGNWAFAAAFAGSHGLAAAAAYLRDLVMVEQFIVAGLPLALSIAWKSGELPGAPLPQSSGHILVVRGFDERGDVIVNDPAQPAIRHVYERDAFARCWLDHGGVALLVAPAGRIDDVVHCANA
jgi:hypothetical protein